MMFNSLRSVAICCLFPVSLAFAGYAPAHAEMVLSQVIVDMQPGKPGHDDIEVWNNGSERMYVVAEPSVIDAPGTPSERRQANPDPGVTGLLVTPQRIVLEPDQRRMIRIASVLPRGPVDKVYRVTIKPVTGPVSADRTAIKILVGYDVLVLYRPEKIAGDVTATRSGQRLTIRNDSNTAQEIYEGKQCDKGGGNCQSLPATRLYAGVSFTQTLPYDTPVEYQVTHGDGTVFRRF